jgi:drug/metabolite transporter (DMT)-like permease
MLPPAVQLRSLDTMAPSRPESCLEKWQVRHLLWPAIVAVGIIMSGSHATLISHARIASPGLSPAMVVLLQEVVKLVCCLGVVRGRSCSTALVGRPRLWMLCVLPPSPLNALLLKISIVLLLSCFLTVRYVVPALCYAFNNNVAVYLQVDSVKQRSCSFLNAILREAHFQTQMDAATFHVLCNMKILTTAILYRVILGRMLSPRKWLALFLLFAGSALNAMASVQEEHAWDYRETFITWTGMVVMLFYCVVSGFAGVYTELLMRQHMQQSMFEQGSSLSFLPTARFPCFHPAMTSRHDIPP